MNLLLKMLSSARSRESYIFEDIFLTISSLISELESEFGKYVSAVLPYVCEGLKSHDEYRLCFVAVGLVGDLARSLEKQIMPFCDEIMGLLFLALQSSSIHRDVKPPVLATFGDVCFAIGGTGYQKYLQLVMSVLEQAGSIKIAFDSYEDLEYFQELSESILSAFASIIHGFKSENLISAVFPYAEKILSYIHNLSCDENVNDVISRNAIALLGDIADSFGPQVKVVYQQDWIVTFIRKCRMSRKASPQTKAIADWAVNIIARLTRH